MASAGSTVASGSKATPECSPQKERVDPALVSSFQRKNIANLAEIKDKLNNNLELQLMVLSTITDWEKASRVMQSQPGTGSVSELLSKKHKKKTLEEDGPAQMEAVDPTEVLHRNRACYCFWGPKLLKHALEFMTDGKLNKKTLAKLTKNQTLEVFEYATDIRVTGDSLDKARAVDGVLNKLRIFEKLKDTYIQQGKRIDQLPLDQVAKGNLDWAKYGHYQVTTTRCDGKLQVNVTNNTLKQSTTMDEGFIAGDEGPFDFIENNFSQYQASLATSKDTYKLQFLFPTLGRSLKRRLSESGAIGDVPASPGKRVAMEACGDVGGTGHQTTTLPAPAEEVSAEAEAVKEQLGLDDSKGAATEQQLGPPPSPEEPE